MLSLWSSDVVQVSRPAVSPTTDPLWRSKGGSLRWGVSCPARSASLQGQPHQGWEGARVAVNPCFCGWGGCLHKQQQSPSKLSHNAPPGNLPCVSYHLPQTDIHDSLPKLITKCMVVTPRSTETAPRCGWRPPRFKYRPWGRNIIFQLYLIHTSLLKQKRRWLLQCTLAYATHLSMLLISFTRILFKIFQFVHL